MSRLNLLGNRKLVSLSPLVVSCLLIATSMVVGNISVRTTTASGSTGVYYPYDMYASYLSWSGWALLFFGLMSFPVIASEAGTNKNRSIVGSGFLALGLTGVLFAVSTLLFTEEDYVTRCYSITCAPFFQLNYQLLVLLGGALILTAAGVWLRLQASRGAS